LEENMDGRGIGAVALRVWGLVLLLGTITVIPGVILSMTAAAYPEDQAAVIRASQMSSLLHLLAGVALGLCLLLWADGLARLALPDTTLIHLGVSQAELLAVGLALVGAVTLVHGLSDAAGLGYVLRSKPKWGDLSNTQYLWEREAEAMVRAGVNVLAGCVLLLGRNGLARTWAQLRSIARTGRGLTRG
jgi:hypothetical protein